MTWFLGEFTKDAQDIADTGFDWDANDFLANRSTTISTSTWSVSDASLTIVTSSKTNTTTLVRLSAGTAGVLYDLTNHVVLANGEEYDRTIRVTIQAR
jgi:hypothetical protein